jgi:hypothetical protein
MNRDEYEELIKLHPKLFHGIDNVECHVGWLTLLMHLCEIIEDRIDFIPFEIQHGFYAVQIKEKFGTLRFYMNQQDDYMSGAIRMAENMSAHICEECGARGRVRHSLAWVKTLCDAHFKDKE